jgi:hypothetical protein
MAQKKSPSKKATVKNYVKNKGWRLPHGYEVVVRKKKPLKRKK